MRTSLYVRIYASLYQLGVLVTCNHVLNIIGKNVNLSEKINWGNFHFKTLLLRKKSFYPSLEFTIIGVSETHFKDKSNEFYNIPGFNFEQTNRSGRENGGVCAYIW